MKEQLDLKERIKKSIANKTKEEAIEDLEDRIFYEQMAERMDFKYVNVCEEIIKELKNGE